MANAVGQGHALIYCRGRYRRPLAIDPCPSATNPDIPVLDPDADSCQREAGYGLFCSATALCLLEAEVGGTL